MREHPNGDGITQMYGNRGAGGDALGWDSLKGTSNRHLLKHILGEKIRHPGEWCSLLTTALIL